MLYSSILLHRAVPKSTEHHLAAAQSFDALGQAGAAHSHHSYL